MLHSGFLLFCVCLFESQFLVSHEGCKNSYIGKAGLEHLIFLLQWLDYKCASSNKHIQILCFILLAILENLICVDGVYIDGWPWTSSDPASSTSPVLSLHLFIAESWMLSMHPAEMPFPRWCHWHLTIMNGIHGGLPAVSFPEELSGLSSLKQ